MMKCYCVVQGEKYNEDPIRSDAKWSEVKKLRVELMGGHFSKLPSLDGCESQKTTSKNWAVFS